MIFVKIIFAIIVISVNFRFKLPATVRRLMKRRSIVILIIIGIFIIIIIIVIIAKSNILRLTLLIHIPLLQPILMRNSG